MAMAWSASVALDGRSTSCDTRLQRPCAAGGPTRPLLPPRTWRGRTNRAACRRALLAAGSARALLPLRAPCKTARSGVSESLVTSPAQTKSHNAASNSVSVAPRTALRNWPQKHAPRSPRAVRIWSCTPPTGASSCSNAGKNAASWSAKNSRIRPSLPPSEPAPTHTTSPLVHKSSSSVER